MHEVKMFLTQHVDQRIPENPSVYDIEIYVAQVGENSYRCMAIRPEIKRKIRWTHVKAGNETEAAMKMKDIFLTATSWAPM